uniref:Uncharacterized protein n=1 Tax=Arundo donax TaxID=35708 RepID=A0A0A9DEH8_ARUDO
MLLAVLGARDIIFFPLIRMVATERGMKCGSVFAGFTVTFAKVFLAILFPHMRGCILDNGCDMFVFHVLSFDGRFSL